MINMVDILKSISNGPHDNRSQEQIKEDYIMNHPLELKLEQDELEDIFVNVVRDFISEFQTSYGLSTQRAINALRLIVLMNDKKLEKAKSKANMDYVNEYTDDQLKKYQHYINAATVKNIKNIDKTIKALEAVEARADSIKKREFYYKSKTTKEDYLKRMSYNARGMTPVRHYVEPYLDDEDEY